MISEIRYASRMVAQADDLLDRARDVLTGNPELTNEQWAEMHRALVASSKLHASLLLILSVEEIRALPELVA